MKNQYVGDINDYRKYGLIHSIANIFGKKILFVWMLTDYNDGNKIGYLEKPNKYRNCNPKLFDELKMIVAKKQKREINKENIIAVENNPFFKEYSFFSEIIKDDKESRDEYFKKVVKLAENHDTIFLDPDNGIEVSSCKRGNKNSSKYVYWDEIYEIFKPDKNILIYQHFPRIDHIDFTNKIIKECEGNFKNAKIIPIVTPDVLFIFIVQKKEDIENKMKALKGELKKWGKEMKIVELQNEKTSL
jgi:hypothetical protein